MDRVLHRVYSPRALRHRVAHVVAQATSAAAAESTDDLMITLFGLGMMADVISVDLGIVVALVIQKQIENSRK